MSISWITPRAGWIRMAIVVVVVLALTPSAFAQSTISATASFDRSVCYLGDQVTLVISVENADSVEPPDLSGVPGGSFVFRGTSNESSTSVSIINGRRRESSVKRLVMRWVVTPNETGSVIVPPVLVRVGGGQVVETEEARLRVLEPEREPREVLSLSVDSETVYVNQPVRVRVSWRLLDSIEDYSFRASRADDGLQIQPLEQPRRNNQQRYQIDIFGGTGLGTLGYDTMDGQRVRAMEFELLVTPTRPGSLDLGPIVVTYDARIDRVSSRRMIAESVPITFDVRPMPTDGRPDNFGGLLGTHGIEANAEPTSVSVGDPIGFEVTIFGPEPMPGVQDGPDLVSIPAFADGFRLASDGWTFRPGSRPGERTFTTTIRVADPSVTEIPSIPLWFFDPESGSYQKAESEAIPLAVRAVREITAADAVVAASGSVAVSRDPLTRTDAGVWAIERGPGVLASSDPLAGTFWREPVFVAVAAAPPAMFAVAGLVALRRRQHRAPASRRRARALREAKRVLAREGPAEAVRRYLGDVFGASPEAITGADGARLLSEAGIDDPGHVTAVIDEHEAEGYGRGGKAVSASSRAGVITMLERIDRQLKRSSGSGPRPTRHAGNSEVAI